MGIVSSLVVGFPGSVVEFYTIPFFYFRLLQPCGGFSLILKEPAQNGVSVYHPRFLS